MSNSVLVIDTNKQPQLPVNPGMARRLLKEGKAAVFRRYPFTIILKEERNKEPTPCQVKIDPGSKTTGMAIVQGDQVIWGAELEHRGQQIKNDVESRRSLRRGRRGRQTRYRAPRFLNRTRPKGWLPPSLAQLPPSQWNWFALTPMGCRTPRLKGWAISRRSSTSTKCASICLKSGIAPVPTVVLKTPRWKWSTLCRNLRGAAIG